MIAKNKRTEFGIYLALLNYFAYDIRLRHFWVYRDHPNPYPVHGLLSYFLSQGTCRTSGLGKIPYYLKLLLLAVFHLKVLPGVSLHSFLSLICHLPPKKVLILDLNWKPFSPVPLKAFSLIFQSLCVHSLFISGKQGWLKVYVGKIIDFEINSKLNFEVIEKIRVTFIWVSLLHLRSENKINIKHINDV